MNIRQHSSGGSVNISSNGSVVIDGAMSGTVVSNGEVWINGERCYPAGLIIELDEAYRAYAMAIGALGHPTSLVAFA